MLGCGAAPAAPADYYSEPFRPQFHFTPEKNWMNDPNGMVYFEGEYHLFYQFNPFGDKWGHMSWGHAVSPDMVHWENLPIALYEENGVMIFSGSAVIDWKNTSGFGEKAFVAIFTYNRDYKETQNLAYSTDNGRTWTKYPGNPVIPAPDSMRDFRDPKVFWHEDHWVMSLAAGDRILFYVSQDLIHWEQSGSFGSGFGCTEGVWETPDLFPLPVDATNESRWVLTVGVGVGAPAGGSGTQYFIGHFDGRNFTSENPKDTILWADYGADYYAPQSWNDEPNGRRLMIGWMNNWPYARLIPESGWRGSFSIIREAALTRTTNGIRLLHRPVHELRSLHSGHFQWRNETIEPGINVLQAVRGGSLEIAAEFQISHEVDSFGLRVRVGPDEQTTIGYNVKEAQLSVDRTGSGRVDFHEDFARVHTAKLTPIDDIIRLHIFVDTISVEVFANDGLVVFSECIFPNEESQALELFVEGGKVLLNSLDIYPLQPATFQTAEN